MLKRVITLPRFTDRHEQFQLDNPTITDFQWEIGIDPRLSADRDSFISEHVEVIDPSCTWRPSSISSAMSHLALIKECASGKSFYTIMEDDAILVSDFDQRTGQLIDGVNGNFDLIQWGFNWDAYLHFYTFGDFGPISTISHAQQEHLFDLKDFSESGKASQLKRLVSSWGSHCYTISPTGAQKILSNYPRVRDIEVKIPSIGQAYWPESFDGVLNGMHATLDTFVAFPPRSFVHNDKAVSKIWV